jgi:hypothetical protein
MRSCECLHETTQPSAKNLRLTTVQGCFWTNLRHARLNGDVQAAGGFELVPWVSSVAHWQERSFQATS